MTFDDRVGDLVQEAIANGMSVDAFRKLCAQMWDYEMCAKSEKDRETWREKP